MAEIPGLFISVRTSAVVGIIQVLNVRGREDRENCSTDQCVNDHLLAVHTPQ